MQNILAGNVADHLRSLTQDIGIRLAGSAGEKRAAEYIADHLRSVCNDVRVEEFDMTARAVAEEHLEVCVGGQWQTFPCSLLSNARGTDGETIEAPLVFFSPQTDFQRQDLSCLSGKAIVFLNSFVESGEQYRRLFEAKPAFLMFVDVRYPDHALSADGMFPVHTQKHGAMSIVKASYMDAWRWKEQDASRARLRVVGGMERSSSQNVIAELPGDNPDAGILIVGGHHDTQADSVGADDNGTGVVAVLELARALADVPRKRTIRLISFGCEEQLSVGSAAYVRRHREELLAHGKFVLNFDAYGSLLGWTELSCCGPDEMGQHFTSFFADRGEYVSMAKEAMPLADHFPFAACGIPSAWLGRYNCTSGRFFHHRPDDIISRISIPLVTKLLSISSDYLLRMAQQDTLPFAPTIPQDQMVDIEKTWQELFGGWTGTGPV